MCSTHVLLFFEACKIIAKALTCSSSKLLFLMQTFSTIHAIKMSAWAMSTLKGITIEHVYWSCSEFDEFMLHYYVFSMSMKILNTIYSFHSWKTELYGKFKVKCFAPFTLSVNMNWLVSWKRIFDEFDENDKKDKNCTNRLKMHLKSQQIHNCFDWLFYCHLICYFWENVYSIEVTTTGRHLFDFLDKFSMKFSLSHIYLGSFHDIGILFSHPDILSPARPN